jgi:hypothetical protein
MFVFFKHALCDFASIKGSFCLFSAETNFPLQQPIRGNDSAQTDKTTAGKAN